LGARGEKAVNEGRERENGEWEGGRGGGVDGGARVIFLGLWVGGQLKSGQADGTKVSSTPREKVLRGRVLGRRGLRRERGEAGLRRDA